MRSTSKKKYYVVRKGRQKGVFESWDVCKLSVAGFPNAQYKSFSNKDLAQQALAQTYEQYVGKNKRATLSPQDIKKYGQPVAFSLSVDAACSNNPGVLEFRGVITGSKKQVFAYGPYEDGTVNVGEFLALVAGLRYAKKHKISLIYTDSITASARVRDRCVKTTLHQTPANEQLFQQIEKALQWLRTNDTQNITIQKRPTHVRGEIPADYGRK